MVRIPPTTVRGAIALTLFGMVALGQLVGAQTSVPRPNFAITTYPSLFYTPIAADFDNDGKADIVAGRPNGGSPDVVFRHGRGDGTFGPEQVIATGVAPVAAGDFNRDGRLDVLVRGYSILPGRGDGTFGAPVATGVADAGERVVVADFNGDRRTDFAASTVDGDTVQFFAGHDDFTFTPSPVYTTDPYTEQMAVGDFNGDRRLDLAVAAIDLKRVNLFINQGGMTFAQSYVPLDRSPLGVAVFDVDGDSVEDLIVSATDLDYANFVFTDGFVYVFHGNGDGTFTETGHYQTQSGPRVITLGDFNRDGVLDVASGNRSLGYDTVCDGTDGVPDNVSILPGLASGGFGTAATFAPAPQAPPLPPPGSPLPPAIPVSTSLQAADLNGDGRFDLLAAGAVLLNVPAVANRAPVANAGPDHPDEASPDFGLVAQASDADNDWLSFEWTDDTGRVVGRLPRSCVFGQWYGRHTFTLTVRDGRGGVGTDTVTITFPDPPLPSGWSGCDVGAVSANGSDTFDGTTYTVRGSGADVWGNADEFHFAYQLLTGDFEISGRVASVENVNAWTKAGFMMRESLAANARHAFLIATPTTTKGVVFQRRTTVNGASVSTQGPHWAPPVYFQLVRRGNTISALTRLHETDPWNLIGFQTYSGLASTLYVGMAVSSHVDGRVATATFDNVQTSTVAESPQLDVLRPLAGESVQTNAPYIVRWTPVNTALEFTKFDVYYSTAGDAGPWTAIPECTTVDPSLRYCVWHRPAPAGSAWVRVVGTTTTGSTEAVSYEFHIDIAAHGSGNLPPGWWCGGVGMGEPQTVGCDYEVEDELSPNFVVTADGSDIWGTQDHFGWAGTPVYGDFTVTARVVNVQNVNAWTKAGLMIRVLGPEEPTSENGDAPHASFFVTPTTVKGTAFQRRPAGGGTSVSTTGPAFTAPIWMRMQRRGNTIYAWYRKNPADQWSLMGSQTFTNELPYQLYAMMAVSSHVIGKTATARFDNVIVDDDRIVNQADIGAITTAGRGSVSTALADASTTVKGSGADIWGTADAFHYLYTRWNGDGLVIVRVKNLENTNAWAKAGIMFRETLDPGSKQVMAVVSPSKGIAMQYRASTGGASAQAGQAPGHAPVWLMLRRFGNHFEAYWSLDGESWTNIGVADVPMSAALYVGLPVTSHVDGSTLATAIFDDIHFIP